MCIKSVQRQTENLMFSLGCQEKRRTIFKSFIESQFKYCPLTWMFCSRKSNNKISRFHEKSLRIVNNNHESTNEDIFSHNNCLVHNTPFGY